ncbi:MAG: rRNA adenine dimethyltransferase family protein [Hyphomicrobiales bacterium]|nr:rRNA adenine dimethyltransferase family protein [Hyphomicrobiales bacterium]
MTQIDDLPPLREVIRKHGLTPKKSLGQNFLHDLNLTARIARAAEPLENITVVEIGDERALDALSEIAAHYPGRLDVVSGDALKIDVSEQLGPERARIVANLPYNIGTVLLIGWLTAEPWPPWYDSMVLMFQREVAERIVARVGDKGYGRLAVLAGWRTEAKILFDVAPTAFVPPPSVTSSVVRLVPRAEPLACDAIALQRVTEAAFGQRRKMLRQSLKSLGVDTGALLAGAGIEPTARAEEIDVAGFVTLARTYVRLRAGTSEGG